MPWSRSSPAQSGPLPSPTGTGAMDTGSGTAALAAPPSPPPCGLRPGGGGEVVAGLLLGRRAGPRCRSVRSPRRRGVCRGRARPWRAGPLRPVPGGDRPQRGGRLLLRSPRIPLRHVDAECPAQTAGDLLKHLAEIASPRAVDELVAEV